MKFIWPDSARSELPSVDKETAVRILHALTRLADGGEGEPKAIKGRWQGCFRLRVGNHRVIFSVTPGEIIEA
jgi:mRNA-degrading endonuclease RelE of RelBE toxin-antitoxin system